MGIRDIWRDVITAIETASPNYDRVNHFISLGLDRAARTYAARKAHIHRDMKILDLGIGPGVMSEIILQNSDNPQIVGLDFSELLIKQGRRRLSASGKVHYVRGVFENLPFQGNTFDAVFMAFAFRDARDMKETLHQIAKVCKNTGLLAIVDVGKPDSSVKRLFLSAYLLIAMPLIARLLTIGRTSENPWTMLLPTYQALPTNQEIAEMLATRFRQVDTKGFMVDGMVVFLATGVLSPEDCCAAAAPVIPNRSNVVERQLQAIHILWNNNRKTTKAPTRET